MGGCGQTRWHFTFNKPRFQRSNISTAYLTLIVTFDCTIFHFQQINLTYLVFTTTCKLVFANVLFSLGEIIGRIVKQMFDRVRSKTSEKIAKDKIR